MTKRNIGIAGAVSALLHLALVLWLVAPRVEVAQLAGGGASFGISQGDMELAEDTLNTDVSTDELVAELEELVEREPLPVVVAQVPALPVPVPVSQPVRQAAEQYPQSPPPQQRLAVNPLRNAAPASQAGNRLNDVVDSAPRQNTGTGAGSARTGAGNADVTNYKARVLRHLERRRRSNTIGPGSAHIRLVIATNGQLKSSSIARSSGSNRFDREALRMVRRASPFPKPHPGIGRSFYVEIEGG